MSVPVVAPRALRRRRHVAAYGLVPLAALLALVPSSAASAHAIVEDVVPADGSALADAPTDVVVTFSEEMLVDGLDAELTAAGGRTDLTATLDPSDPHRVVVALPPVAAGTYQVRVEALDAEDLHRVVARTSFGVGGAAPDASAPVTAPPAAGETAARWTFAFGLALIVGVLSVRRRAASLLVRDPVRHRLTALVLVGVVAVLAGRIGILVARLVALGGPWAGAARSVAATADAQRLPLVLVAVGCVVVGERASRLRLLDVPLWRRGRMTCREALAWFGVVDLALIASFGDHSALGGGEEPLTVAAKLGHLLGLGLWVGVLAVVLALGAPLRRRGLSAMGDVAVAGAVLTVTSGLVLASRLVVSLTALLSTPYGLLLAAKLLLVPLAAAIGLAVRSGRRTRWSVVELAVLAGALLLGAGMATATPAIDPSFLDRAAEKPDVRPAVAADDLLVQVRAIPGRPGPNTIELRLADTRRPSPGPATTIDVAIGDQLVSVSPGPDGLAFAPSVDLTAGETPVGLRIHRDGWRDAVADTVVDTDVPAYVHPVRISSAPLRAPLLVLAATLGPAVWLGALVGGRRRTARSGAARSVRWPQQRSAGRDHHPPRTGARRRHERERAR